MIALQGAPASDAASSSATVGELEDRLRAEFMPIMTLERLTQESEELLRLYDRERQRMIASGPDVHGSVVNRLDGMQCTHVGALQPRDALSHKPRVIWSPNAADFYPLSARRDMLTGRVLLQVTTDVAGCAQRMEVVRSCGAPELDDAALNLVARVQFAPEARDGKFVASSVLLPVVFNFTTPMNAGSSPGAGTTPSAASSSPTELRSASDHLQTGNRLSSSREYYKAIAEYDIAIAETKNAVAYANRGLAHLWNHDVIQAQADFADALRIEPNNAIALRGRGQLEYIEGRCDSAVQDLTHSFELDSKSSLTLRWRADAESCLLQDAAALDDLTAAEKMEPKTYSSYSQRALLLRALRRPEEALREVDKLLAISSDSPAQLTAGEIYAAAGKVSEAAATLDMAVRTGATEKAYLTRAEYRAPAEPLAQREDYEAALKLNPNSTGALRGLVREWTLEGGDPSDALNAAMAAHPEDVVGSVSRGIVLWRQGHRAAAENELQSAIQRANHTQFNDICFSLAFVSVSLETALEACNRSLAAMPNYSHFLDSRGLVYLRLGRLDDALADYNRALKFNPHLADSLYGRGIVFARLKRSANAEADSSEALRLDFRIADVFRRMGLSK